MSKKTQKYVKKREEKTRNKILKRRETIQTKAKKEREEYLEQLRSQKIANRVDGRTIVNRSPEDQHDLLQNNIAILEALEEERKRAEQAQAPPPPPKRGMKQSADVVFIPNPETNEPLVQPEK
jgi:hypothetical protein